MVGTREKLRGSRVAGNENHTIYPCAVQLALLKEFSFLRRWIDVEEAEQE